MSERVTLIVDDDPAVVRTLREALGDHRVRVESAATVAAAKEMLAAKRYCGLVLDIVLEEGNGFEVLRFLEERKMRVPTVVVSQKMPAYVREMLDDEHVKLVFPKPIEPRLLATIVLGLCGIPAD